MNFLGKVLAFYHYFSAQESTVTTTDDAGSELDLLYTYSFANGINFLAKATFFSGESNSVITAAQNDVTKYWVQFQLSILNSKHQNPRELFPGF